MSQSPYFLEKYDKEKGKNKINFEKRVISSFSKMYKY